MKTEDKVLIGLAAIGVGLTAILVAKDLAVSPPIFQAQPAQVRTEGAGFSTKGSPIFSDVWRIGAETGPSWSEQHRQNANIYGGLQSFHDNAGHAAGFGPQPPSILATAPRLIGGSQGFVSGSSGGKAAANPPGSWATHPGTFGY